MKMLPNFSQHTERRPRTEATSAAPSARTTATAAATLSEAFTDLSGPNPDGASAPRFGRLSLACE